MSEIFFIIGGALFGILGLVHAFYTFTDSIRPRRLVPDKPVVMQDMASTGVCLAKGDTTMWRAWVGFNLSHSLGALIFNFCCVSIGVLSKIIALPSPVLLFSASVLKKASIKL
jgi:hypothetical protein